MLINKLFIDQNIDGEVLEMVAKEGSLDQLKACGLKTVADQMKLRKLVVKKTTSSDRSPPPSERYSGSRSKWPGRKLTKLEMKEIASPEERRIYLMK